MLSGTRTVVLSLYKDSFVTLKKREEHVGCLMWFSFQKSCYILFDFSLYLHVVILALQTRCKREAMLSSRNVCPDNFSPPFLNIEMRQKVCGDLDLVLF